MNARSITSVALGVVSAATCALAACSGSGPAGGRVSCVAAPSPPPTRQLTVIFWYVTAQTDVTMSFDGLPLGRTIRLGPVTHMPAVSGECTATIPARTGLLRICAPEGQRCAARAIPAEGDQWVQVSMNDPNAPIIDEPSPMPPAID